MHVKAWQQWDWLQFLCWGLYIRRHLMHGGVCFAPLGDSLFGDFKYCYLLPLESLDMFENIVPCLVLLYAADPKGLHVPKTEWQL